jgi:hypothetical protein
MLAVHQLAQMFPHQCTTSPLGLARPTSPLESDDLQDWVLGMQPRSRVDCYPLYLLTKELLQQLALGKCEVISSELSALQSSLAQHR